MLLPEKFITMFDKQEDFDIFHQDLPPNMTAPLQKNDLTAPQHLINRIIPLEYQEPGAAFADLHQEYIFGTYDKIENE